MSKKIDITLEIKTKELYDLLDNNKEYLAKFTNYETLNLVEGKEVDKNQCVTAVLSDVIVVLPLAKLVDLAEEKAKLVQNKEKLVKEIERCNQMLSNPNFVNKAPQAKVDAEKEKLVNYQKQLEEVCKLLESFN